MTNLFSLAKVDATRPFIRQSKAPDSKGPSYLVAILNEASRRLLYQVWEHSPLLFLFNVSTLFIWDLISNGHIQLFYYLSLT